MITLLIENGFRSAHDARRWPRTLVHAACPTTHRTVFQIHRSRTRLGVDEMSVDGPPTAFHWREFVLEFGRRLGWRTSWPHARQQPQKFQLRWCAHQTCFGPYNHLGTLNLTTPPHRTLPSGSYAHSLLNIMPAHSIPADRRRREHYNEPSCLRNPYASSLALDLPCHACAGLPVLRTAEGGADSQASLGHRRANYRPKHPEKTT
ncbi:hypothetical protein B0H19DRAFT_1249037 [Mycena capillaripes]|nr:hypothetical protein B0H19DRAFT_1249037 [Mycena capillaripes]